MSIYSGSSTEGVLLSFLHCMNYWSSVTSQLFLHTHSVFSTDEVLLLIYSVLRIFLVRPCEVNIVHIHDIPHNMLCQHLVVLLKDEVGHFWRDQKFLFFRNMLINLKGPVKVKPISKEQNTSKVMQTAQVYFCLRYVFFIHITHFPFHDFRLISFFRVCSVMFTIMWTMLSVFYILNWCSSSTGGFKGLAFQRL